MIQLSVDASGKSAACALTNNGKLIASEFTNSGLTHSQTLLPLIDKMLKKADVSIDRIDSFAVTNGPGSFTGLRIGMALIMGLAGEKPCVAVPTLQALAYNMVDTNGIIIPVMDARRNQVYTAVFESKDGIISRLEQDCAISVEQVIENLKKYTDKPIWIIGDGAYLFKDTVDFINFPDEDKLYPSGFSIALASQNIQPSTAKQLKINYLRLSQAERELKEKKKNEN